MTGKLVAGPSTPRRDGAEGHAKGSECLGASPSPAMPCELQGRAAEDEGAEVPRESEGRGENRRVCPVRVRVRHVEHKEKRPRTREVHEWACGVRLSFVSLGGAEGEEERSRK